MRYHSQTLEENIFG